MGGPQFRVGPDQDARLETICGAYYWFIDGSIRARFVSLLPVHKDMAGEDQGTGLFARLGEAALDDQEIEPMPIFHRSGLRHGGAR